jgi:hypothetical protein
MPARTRVFLDALQEEFSGPKCQESEAAVRRMMAATDSLAPLGRGLG